jgi:pentatricopeptide repeat protein
MSRCVKKSPSHITLTNTPCPPFIHFCSDNPKNLDFAFEQLRQLRQEGKPVTTASLNAMMSGAAERGEIDRILFLLQEFDRNNVEPDAETFSFGFESLGKNLRRRSKNPGTQDHIDACLVAAESFLTMMDDRDIEPTHHIIRDYVELLCLVGQVDTATTIVLEAACEEGLLGSKTVYRVAMTNAKMQRFDIARQVAMCNKGEPMPFLLESIDQEERLVSGPGFAAAKMDENDSHPTFWRRQN